MSITLHKPEDYQKMRIAGRLAAETLDMIGEHVKAGVTTNEINQLCHDFITSRNAIPAPLGYRGYPKSVCTSVNHVVCHGIPNDEKLKEGDIINIDVTTIVDGWHGDTSRMYFVGRPRVISKRLVQVTYEAMMKGISVVKPGAYVGDIGHAIQTYAEGFNYSIVRDYCGHGIGQIFHTQPNVMHFGKPGTGVKLEEGMFFTVEPMINVGRAETKLNQHDGWTVTTRDRSLSAQFEHTIGVTKDGFEIFTQSPTGHHHPEW